MIRRGQAEGDVVGCKVNIHLVPLGDFSAEAATRYDQSQVLEFRRVQAMGNRLNLGADIG